VTHWNEVATKGNGTPATSLNTDTAPSILGLMAQRFLMSLSDRKCSASNSSLSKNAI